MRLRWDKLIHAGFVVLVCLGISAAQEDSVSSPAAQKQASCASRKAAAANEKAEMAALPAEQRPAVSAAQPPAASAPPQRAGSSAHLATAQSSEAKSETQEAEQPSLSKNYPMMQPSCSADTPAVISNSQSSEATPDSEQSLAAAAARAKSEKSGHAKKMITDDDLDSTIGPLPRLKTNAAENGEEVIAAITKYKQTHTAAETEEVVHRWYDEYDAELADAINSNLDIRNTRAANMRNEYDLCQMVSYQDYEEYRRCQARNMAEQRGARHDQVEMMRNSEWITRLQHSLMNIRSRIFLMGLNYPWFKVRTTNGIDRF